MHGRLNGAAKQQVTGEHHFLTGLQVWTFNCLLMVIHVHSIMAERNPSYRYFLCGYHTLERHLNWVVSNILTLNDHKAVLIERKLQDSFRHQTSRRIAQTNGWKVKDMDNERLEFLTITDN